jgi:hypothetical protein
MPWICPDCRSSFGTPSPNHECAAVLPFTIGSETPDGGPQREMQQRAVSHEVQLEEALRWALRLVLTATRGRVGHERTIDPRTFHRAIRTYRPKSKFPHITRLDEIDYACRAAERLINQATGIYPKLPGRYSSSADVLVKAEAIYDRIVQVAREHGVDISTETPTA